MIKKNIGPSVSRINSLREAQVLRLETEHYLLKGYDISIEKIERGYSAKITFIPFSGYSSSQMHRIELPQPIKLTNSENTYYIPEH